MRTPVLPSVLLPILASSAVGQSSLYDVPGSQPYDLYANEIASGADFDADGFPDLVVGSPEFVSGGWFVGRVQIVSGRTGASIRTIQGAQAQSIGADVDVLGDLDGDGVSELLVEIFQGAVRVYSGATGAVLRSHPAPGGEVRSAALGDVNADGFGDYAIGSTNPAAGVVRVLSGLDGSQLLSFAGTGAPSGTFLKQPVAVGDVDADGRADLAILGFVQAGAQWHGRATVHSGATGAQLVSIDGAFSERFEDAARVGDLDGDGAPELLIGAKSSMLNGFAYSLATGALVRTFAPAQPATSLDANARVAAVPDVDLDGVADVAISSWAPYGVRLHSGATGAVISVYLRAGDCRPPSIAGLPDVDGDGRGEIAIGEPCAAYGALGVPRLRVFPGAAPTAIGAESCFGDGTAAACPCGNASTSGRGCANTTGVGATLRAHGTTSASTDDLWFVAESLPGGSAGSTYLFVGTGLAGGGAGVANFGGIRCIGSGLMRLGQHDWKGGGIASWAGGLASTPSIGAWIAGTTRHFQSLYRDTTSACSPANFTNLVSVTFTP